MLASYLSFFEWKAIWLRMLRWRAIWNWTENWAENLAGDWHWSRRLLYCIVFCSNESEKTSRLGLSERYTRCSTSPINSASTTLIINQSTPPTCTAQLQIRRL
ncbi:hypothetical protein VTL71DRAFT_11574 [Oculimacula yallundae]|uniref:Uncharacterized protein n=1 Tax=Oculimacula yallundae TaxID=86028 RepID=A0ABR4CS74_9HELO